MNKNVIKRWEEENKGIIVIKKGNKKKNGFTYFKFKEKK